MGQTIGSIIKNAQCIFEKRFAEQKGAGFIAGDVYAKVLQAGNYSALRALPTEPTRIKKWSAEHGKEVTVTAGAIWFTECDAIIYGDTDSCYFQTFANSYEEAVERADAIAEVTNESFPEFMQRSFNCTDGRQNLISAAREIVAERGLFMHAKKKYTLRVVNLDGNDLREKPKLKSMGSEIKKADTPKAVQEFLKGLMELVLTGKEEKDLETFVNSNRGSLIHRNEDLLSLGSSKSVNNLDAKYAEWSKIEKPGKGKVNLPGHVRSAINYNEMVSTFDPGGSKLIKSGDKAVVFYLKPNNDFKFTSIAFPADTSTLPAWFDEHFKVDIRKTEEKMIDNKIEGIFEAMDIEMPTPQNSYLSSVFTF